MISHFCDPAWHNGDKTVKANFMITPGADQRGTSLLGYATCELHVGQALRIMLEKLKTVTVREVNKE
jgi:hypothetical protein